MCPCGIATFESHAPAEGLTNGATSRALTKDLLYADSGVSEACNDVLTDSVDSD
jgi:hypothetical protein